MEYDLHEILLYTQRYIENEKIPVGKNGQFMKASHQQTLTKKLFFLKDRSADHETAARRDSSRYDRRRLRYEISQEAIRDIV